MRNDYLIDCNDMGAQFTEGRINCRVSKILKLSPEKMEDLIFPRSPLSGALASHHSLVLVQLNSFNCGGIALSVFINHKLADAYTASTFMNDWAAMTRQMSDIPSPHLIGASLFPPIDVQLFPEESSPPRDQGKQVTRRFSFHTSKIEELRAIAIDSGIENPTRFEVVCALLYSRLISAASKANSRSHPQPSIFIRVMNFRQIIVPPLPQNAVGNFFTYFLTSVDNDDEAKLPELVKKIREGKTKLHKEFTENISANTSKYKQWLLPPLKGKTVTSNPSTYTCTSWCGFPFYGVDFGWGKPSLVWPAHPSGVRSNVLMLIDMEDAKGIYARVTLKESEMSVLQENEVLLAYASLDA